MRIYSNSRGIRTVVTRLNLCSAKEQTVAAPGGASLLLYL